MNRGNNAVQGGLLALSRQIQETIGFAVNPFSIKPAAPVITDDQQAAETRPMVMTPTTCEVEDYCRWTD